MASTLVVPPSKHTLFMRGFSAHQDIDRIREFFKREAGGCETTVEFFKESDARDKLFIALRFETRDAAKDILNRYDSTEVMGDRITISWFKDLRRARQKGLIPYNNNYKNNYADSGGKQFYYNNNFGKPGFRNRFQGGDEEERRRQAARGMSPLRNGFRPGQFKGFRDGEKPEGGQGRGRVRQDSWRRLSSGRRRTDSSMSRSNSRSRSRSYSNSRSRSPRSDRSRTPSRDRSQSPQPSRSSHKTHSPDGRSGDNQDAGRDEKGQWSPDRYSGNRAQTSNDRSPTGSGAKWSRDSRSRDRSPVSHQDPADWERSPEPTKYIRSTVKSVQERKSGEFEDRYSPETPSRYHRTEHSPAADRHCDFDKMTSYQKEKKDSPAASGTRGSWRPVEARPRTPPHTSSPAPPPATEYTREFESRNSRQRDRVSPEHETEVAPKRARDDRYSTEDGDGKRRRYQDENMPDQSPARSRRSRTDHSPAEEKVTSQPSLSAVNGNSDIGALGLPHDKMVLVREKKEEIERAYRQDCETFASVVKMLISKDPDLEGRLQNSLRENLKEIGQRCIHELREFIEKLKTQASTSK